MSDRVTIEVEISRDVAEALMERFGTRDMSLVAQMAINAKAEQLGILDALTGPTVVGSPVTAKDWPARNPLQHLIP